MVSKNQLSASNAFPVKKNATSLSDGHFHRAFTDNPNDNNRYYRGTQAYLKSHFIVPFRKRGHVQSDE